MFAKPDEVEGRRLRRKLKAGASVLVALAAGAFLAACQRAASPGPSPMGPDARQGPRRSDPPPAPPPDAQAPAVDAARHDDAAVDAAPAVDHPPTDDQGLATTADSGLARRPGGHPRRPTVDVHQHRHGMPVLDNLVE